MKILLYIIFGFVSSILSVQADTNIQIASPTNLLPGNPSKDLILVNSDMAGNFIGSIITWAIGLTAVLTVLAITWAGVQMLLAVGEEEKMKKARYTMIYAFIGLIVGGLAYVTVSFVTNLNLDNIL